MERIYTEEENRAWQRTLPGKKCSANVVLFRGDCVLMVKANYKDYWTFPGGVVDEAESPLLAAARETSEEIGIVLRPEDLHLVTTAYYRPKNGFLDHLKFVFRSDLAVDDGAIKFVDHEIEDSAWVHLSDIATRASGRGIYREIAKLLESGSTEGYIEI